MEKEKFFLYRRIPTNRCKKNDVVRMSSVEDKINGWRKMWWERVFMNYNIYELQNIVTLNLWILTDQHFNQVQKTHAYTHLQRDRIIKYKGQKNM